MIDLEVGRGELDLWKMKRREPTLQEVTSAGVKKLAENFFCGKSLDKIREGNR